MNTVNKMETETIDRLFLELSQFTRAKTAQDLRVSYLLNAATLLYSKGNGELAPTVTLLFPNDTYASEIYEILSNLREGNGRIVK